MRFLNRIKFTDQHVPELIIDPYFIVIWELNATGSNCD